MSESSILFPNLGITLSHVGKTISVFGFEIAYYGITIAFAMACGVLLIQRIAGKTGQDKDMYLDVSLITIVCAVVGARLYYVAFSWEDYRDNLLEIFNTRGGGLAIYGGVLAGILTVWIFGRVKKQKFGLLADTICPGLVLGQAIGRWGNFFNREAFGEYTNGLFAMALPKNAVRSGEITASMMEHIQTVGQVEFIQVHPTFLYESLWNAALLLFLLWFMKRKKFHGEIFLLYLAGYGIGRAWIEGLRTDQLLLPGTGLAVSQILSVLLAAAALMILVVKRRLRKDKKDE
ncbi:MAG: prolipoprotein diacylglyceryl transferase [Eubacteriales bacterium]|nr:prolipoprotein diacylglyceryl transferase [Eubacteriales bacterium]